MELCCGFQQLCIGGAAVVVGHTVVAYEGATKKKYPVMEEIDAGESEQGRVSGRDFVYRAWVRHIIMLGKHHVLIL